MIDVLAICIALTGLMCLIGEVGTAKAIDRLTDLLEAHLKKEKKNEKA